MGVLQAGRLNKRVTLQRRASAPGRDAWGQPSAPWEKVATVWANVQTVNGRTFVNQESTAAGGEIARATTSIRIRKRRGIDPTMRVIYGGQVYEIKAVLPDEEGDEFVDLAVSAIVNEG